MSGVKVFGPFSYIMNVFGENYLYNAFHVGVIEIASEEILHKILHENSRNNNINKILNVTHWKSYGLVLLVGS